jgi:hypothetical protein
MNSNEEKKYWWAWYLAVAFFLVLQIVVFAFITRQFAPVSI